MSNVVELTADRCTCGTQGCTRPAKMAISMTRPSRSSIFSRVFFDDRTAPASAFRYCHSHGVATIVQLCVMFSDADDDPEVESAERPALDPTRVQRALSKAIVSLDYDLWKDIETPEDGGESPWSELVAQFTEAYRGESS